MYKRIAAGRARKVFADLAAGNDDGGDEGHGRRRPPCLPRRQRAHWIRIRRGKGVYVHAYLDTDRVTAACRRMAAAGIEEAAAPPIAA